YAARISTELPAVWLAASSEAAGDAPASPREAENGCRVAAENAGQRCLPLLRQQRPGPVQGVAIPFAATERRVIAAPQQPVRTKGRTGGIQRRRREVDEGIGRRCRHVPGTELSQPRQFERDIRKPCQLERPKPGGL